MKIQKTNAMRMLDRAKIPYEIFTYEVDESDLSGTHVAMDVGLPYSQVFKTLVAKGDKTGYVVFVIPVDKEIDLKAAAVASNNKRVEMIAVKDLLSVTGYIRGGCSPVGMKKQFPTYFDASVKNHDCIAVSAGVRGCQLFLDCDKLIEFTKAEIKEVIR
ncbi:MAG: Cys-tRNA(Pro) deacylase [Clostridia bacterium]|nr:Cys-tRNA(Pro) deacylase [Clostridia bacterium]